MLKEILTLIRNAPFAQTGRIDRGDRWRRDPLAHPVIEGMSLNSLADLPAASLRACCAE